MAKPNGPQQAVTPSQIAQRAYELYVREGRPTNRALDHWLAAEREMLGQATNAIALRIPSQVPVRVQASPSRLTRKLQVTSLMS